MKSSLSLILMSLVLVCCKSGGGTPNSAKPHTSDPDISIAPAPTATVSYNPPPVSTPPSHKIDPMAEQAWHLKNIGQKSFAKAGGEIGIDLNIEATTMTGAGVLIAVSDNGIEGEHPDLKTNFSLAFSKDYSLPSPWYGNPRPDEHAHGTAVSGIIGATKNNGTGSFGVAANATIAGLKYIGASYSLSKQVDQANGNYDIFNYSYGGYSCYFDYSPPTYISQLEYGVKNLRNGKGAIYIKAAGNEFVSRSSDCDPSLDDDENLYYFGNANLEEVHSYPWSIVTAAINARGVSSSYSTPGSSLWISAPGGEYGVNYPAILTTDLTGCDRGYAKSSSTRNDFDKGELGNSTCDYTSTMNGTSAATPMVSGVVALMLQANPNLSWRDVKHILAKTARKIDPDRGNTVHPAGYNLAGHTYQLGWITNAAGYNFHNWYGFGLVDVTAAVGMALNYNSHLGTFKSYVMSSPNSLNLSIPDNNANGRSHSLQISHPVTIEAIQISLNVTHPWVGDLGVELTSPAGTKSILMNINSGVGVEDIVDEVLLSNAFYGESASGTWHLKIIDGQSQDIGKLNQWTIRIFGH